MTPTLIATLAIATAAAAVVVAAYLGQSLARIEAERDRLQAKLDAAQDAQPVATCAQWQPQCRCATVDPRKMEWKVAE